MVYKLRLSGLGECSCFRVEGDRVMVYDVQVMASLRLESERESRPNTHSCRGRGSGAGAGEVR